jgi:uncharacterized protein (TIGR00297 family)
MTGSFFFLAVAATKWRRLEKERLGVAEHNLGRRNAGQVLANGGAAGVCGLVGFLHPAHSDFYLLLMAGALSSATADTLSSELGTIYGRRFYNILDLRPGNRGENGVISLEGTLIGIGGSAVIASIFSIATTWNIYFAWILVAGTTGNLADSFLGATLEKKGTLGNDGVNFLNTVVAITTIGILYAVLT